MTTSMRSKETLLGQLFLVTGPGGGREVFLGSALGDDVGDRLRLEGKVLSMTPHGRLVVRPFPTTVTVRESDPSTTLHRLTDPQVVTEARSLLALAATHVNRGAVPNVHAWVSAALQSSSGAPTADPGPATRGEVAHEGEPFQTLYESLLATTEEFRRVLFRTRGVESTRELDRATELEGDLLIEVGRVANQVAVKLNATGRRVPALAAHLEAFGASGSDLGRRPSMAGWPDAFERVRIAKDWARRGGRAELVRELNTLIKDAVFAVHEVILDHGNALDTLITETFGQYGVRAELEHGTLGQVPGQVLGQPPARPPGTLLAGER